MKAQFHLPLATYPDASSFSLLQNAVDFCLHQKAGLTASIPLVRIEPVQPRFPSLLDVANMRAEAERLSKDNGTVLGQTLRDYAKKAEVEVEIQPLDVRQPFVAQTLAELSRAYDLSILEASELMKPLIESVLFESGRPLLLFPPDNFSGRIDAVAVAWDGGATVARTLAGARFLLERVSRIVLISITDDKQIDEGGRDHLATALRKAGLAVDVAAVQAKGDSPANVIQGAALERKADLLVAGAYGHSRLREFILGGVTRSLLTRLEMPTVLCH
ncbi:universal stress protein [Rhizobium leguminosarum]|uniref:Universal stress protein UspA n=2 Tax=Rhizobium leguminosarum TaxID=384 RepID=A0A1B8R5W2_RHILT|nr:universal stress protein [Rhizobium leguminosarum]MDH6663834.1 nucleotide-binding universal stress UspA family protein [Rhizobium sophorae]AOO93112.1 universal stress protein UspA [Rhizobium leguminosarum bv. trifolii]ASS57347.1 universal stress protein [Rhizobium leguminosarum bv. viciae]AVC49874.1 universal stress family protein [Rhizobium leguminosarum bv. viciae]MBB4327107.1 nucleotide-binding universal stress UspA family protein [Rhizobium leguminosarum]